MSDARRTRPSGTKGATATLPEPELPEEVREEGLGCLRTLLDIGDRLTAALEAFSRLSNLVGDLADDPEGGARFLAFIDESGAESLQRLLLAIAAEVEHATGSEGGGRYDEVRAEVLERFPELVRTSIASPVDDEGVIAAIEAAIEPAGARVGASEVPFVAKAAQLLPTEWDLVNRVVDALQFYSDCDCPRCGLGIVRYEIGYHLALCNGSRETAAGSAVYQLTKELAPVIGAPLRAKLEDAILDYVEERRSGESLAGAQTITRLLGTAPLGPGTTTDNGAAS